MMHVAIAPLLLVIERMKSLYHKVTQIWTILIFSRGKPYEILGGVFAWGEAAKRNWI